MKPPPVKGLRGAYPHFLHSAQSRRLNSNLFSWHTAICEAMSRTNMRFITPKKVEQQDLQAFPCLLQETVAVSQN
ncbi:hypothetical protein DN062_15335 [Nitrincola tibetensis]|uniref:Uncharacterized protein n=1 Tax=Nitrincola tibetensis TaxID=2219697 RepID=A0A364NIQ2_9GAMM|nr:hypothetical protein DN062_15335 [Nitrincola tibetensis]